MYEGFNARLMRRSTKINVNMDINIDIHTNLHDDNRMTGVGLELMRGSIISIPISKSTSTSATISTTTPIPIQM